MMTFLSSMLRDDVRVRFSSHSYRQAALMDRMKGLLCLTQQWWGLTDYQDLVYLVGQTCLKCAYALELGIKN